MLLQLTAIKAIQLEKNLRIYVNIKTFKEVLMDVPFNHASKPYISSLKLTNLLTVFVTLQI